MKTIDELCHILNSEEKTELYALIEKFQAATSSATKNAELAEVLEEISNA